MDKAYYWIGAVVFWGVLIITGLWILDILQWKIRQWWPSSKPNQIIIVWKWWYLYDYKDKTVPFKRDRVAYLIDCLKPGGRFEKHVYAKYVLNLMEKQLKRLPNEDETIYSDSHDESDQADQELDNEGVL